jgi:predicted protein tyrosine phosphatase
MKSTDMKKSNLLFVCACNINRSKTFEDYYTIYLPEHNVRSCGIYSGGDKLFNGKLAKWADIIYVMDLSQKLFIQTYYPKYISKVVIIGISDQYDRGSLELVHLIEYWLSCDK